VILGASIIEKHFTLDRSRGGPEESFSLEPGELAALCHGARTALGAMGRVDYGRKSSEIGHVIFRRSLNVVQDIQAGEVLTCDNVRSIRPGSGVAPKHLDAFIGKAASRDVKRATPVLWDYC